MVLAVEARKLSLPLNPRPFPSRPCSSLFDPNSRSLALMLADSSISLFSPFSAFSASSPASLPPPQALISAPSSSACFVRFDPNPNPNPNPRANPKSNCLVYFVAAGPSHDGSKVLIRFLVQSSAGFAPARVECGQRGLDFDRKSGGVVVDCSHGTKVVLAGSVNYFAMYSASAATVWVFGVKSVAEDHGDGRRNLRLVKCALIDCQLPVTSVSMSSRFLIMGELNGVRVFPLRALVKGWAGLKKKTKKAPLGLVSKENVNLEGAMEIKFKNLKLSNGLVGGHNGRYDVKKNELNQVKVKVIAQNKADLPRLVPNGTTRAKTDETPTSSVKPKSQRLSQDSNKLGAIFLPFDSKDEVRNLPYGTKKAISIHGFSHDKFLVADSDGNVHLLCASVSGSSVMKQLSNACNIQQIAVLPDPSESLSTFWLSDGHHSVHVMAASDVNTSSNVRKTDSEDMHFSVVQTIFVSENIQDVQPLSANAILILGQDNLYAYAIS